MKIGTKTFSDDARVAGLEALFMLILSTLSADQRSKLAVNGLELIKQLKNQPIEAQQQNMQMCEYIAHILDSSIDPS